LAINEYEIINKKKAKGDFLSENDLIDLIELTRSRRPKLHKKLIIIYEFIEDIKYTPKTNIKKNG